MLTPICTTDAPEAQERVRAMNKEALDRMMGKASEEPAELPRLTVAGTFLTYQRLGMALETAYAAFKALPDSKSPQDTTERLKELMKASEAAGKHAARLLEANQ